MISLVFPPSTEHQGALCDLQVLQSCSTARTSVTVGISQDISFQLLHGVNNNPENS